MVSELVNSGIDRALRLDVDICAEKDDEKGTWSCSLMAEVVPTNLV